LLADVFEPPSREFLETAAPPRPRVALDLGCGTGRTTGLIAETTGAARTIGIDNSEALISTAIARGRARTEFLRRDVTVMPLPHTPADLVYVRFVLSHVPAPDGFVRAWAEQLGPGGRLLLDEPEYMTTDNLVLNRYEDLVNEVLASRGATLMGGLVLARAAPGRTLRRSFDRLVKWPVAESTAARLYSMNLGTWRYDDYITARYPATALDQLAEELDAIVASGSDTPVEWGIRQVAFERVS
jgi:trans-aconitate 2-methyltransferase